MIVLQCISSRELQDVKYMEPIFINHLGKEEVTLAKSEVAHPRPLARAWRKNIVTSDIQLCTSLVIRSTIERESFSGRRYGNKFFLQTVRGFSGYMA